MKLGSYPVIGEHGTAKKFVDEAISIIVKDLFLLRLEPHQESKLDEQESIIPNPSLTSLETILEIPTKLYIDSLNENDVNWRD